MRALHVTPLLPLLLFVQACENGPVIGPTPTAEIGLWQDAAGSVANLELARLCENTWQVELEHDPVRATYLGDPRWHHRVEGISAVFRAKQREDLAGLLQRARKISPALLGAEDLVTYEVLVEHLEQGIERIDLDLDAWSINPLGGPQIDFLTLASDQPVRTAREREQLVARWHDMAHHIRDRTNNLQRGVALGRVASRTAIEKVAWQIEALLRTDPLESPLVRPATGGGTWVPFSPASTLAALAYQHYGSAAKAEDLSRVNLHVVASVARAEGTRVLIPAADDALSAEERGRFLDATLRAVRDDIYPAFQEYRRALAVHVLPHARSDEQPGLAHLTGGARIYRTLIRHHTSLDLGPDEIHALGLAEVERVRGEIAALGGRLFGTTNVPEIQRRLRGDPAMFFTSREEVEAKATESVMRARRKLPQFFGKLPLASCEVVRVPAHEEADTTIAYYREPAADGSRPGRYYINTFEPETRPRYDAAVLAFHEALPGHHLQIAIAQELEGLPLFRRHSGNTAFVEGWALYTERLCDEMGLYESDLDRLGMLSFDAWRACRLVVDTGIHEEGWSRDRAIEYLLANTLLAPNNCENEVDRYIAWPGQALAYKLGQRQILTLRDRARAALGGSFSYPEFHDRVLENGAVSLAILERCIDRWLAQGAG